MTLVQGRSRPCRECPSVALLDSSPSLESEFFEQPAGYWRAKLLITVVSVTATDVSIYIKNDLQQIFKTILEAGGPALAPALAPVPATSEEPWDKLLKARSPDVYYEKSHMDCYNFCQQWENYFVTVGAIGANRIFFATSFLKDRISFC